MIHPFSLMDRDSHPESIYELLQLKVDRAMIGTPFSSFKPLGFSPANFCFTATVVEECIETVEWALGVPTTSSGRSSVRALQDAEFATFVERVLKVAEVSVTDILITLVYLRRAKAHLSVDAEKWVLHRVFLGALVLAHKVSPQRGGVDPPYHWVEFKIFTFISFVVFQRLDAEKRQLVVRVRCFRNEGHREDGEGVP
jgi:hypothetical protein